MQFAALIAPYVLAQTLGLTIEELIGVASKSSAKPAPKQHGPAPKIQQQLERVSALPKAKQGRRVE